MSDQITTAMVQGYKQGVVMLAQQKKSRLRDAVKFMPMTSKREATDQLGPTTAVKKTGRHTDTPLVNSEHQRRWIQSDPYEWADLIDDPDKLRTINDFTNPYMLGGSMAMGRAMDDAIVAAFFATAITGENGGSTAAFDTANFTIANAGAGLTIAKLLTAKEKLDAAENDPDDNPRFVAASAKQFTNLLSTTEIKSSDYNTVKALVNGEVNTFLGFNFIRTERLAKASNDRRVAAWCKKSMSLGVLREVKTDIGPRRDKSMATQVYVCMDIGATREDEKGVVEILCTET